MSGLEALGLACNIMAVITFALDTAKVCRAIHKTGSSDPDLKQNTSRIKQTFKDVDQALQQKLTGATDAEKRIRELAADCMKYARQIEDELDYISRKKPGTLATLKSTFHTVRRKRHIDDCTHRLEAAKSVMDSALFGQILSECMQSKVLNNATYNALNQQQKVFLASNRQVQDLLIEFRTSEETQAYDKLLCSLKYAEMNSRKTSIPHRHDRTFEWIFEESTSKGSPDPAGSGEDTDDAIRSNGEGVGISGTTIRNQDNYNTQQKVRDAALVEWLREDRRCIYWVNGKPGSGKSTFMKFIENDKRTHKALGIWQPQCNIISHYLWKPGTENQHSLKGMLCSLYYQVLCEEKHFALRQLRDTPSLAHRNDIADWDLDDVSALLFEALRCSSSAYLLLLDGLDELSRSYRGTNKLFPLLQRLAEMDRLKICVSSRPERPFTDRFEFNPSLRMQELTHGDIQKYTTDFLGEIQLQPQDKLHHSICFEITRRAEGVFVWVYVVLQSIKHGIDQYNETWDDIYARIIKLPPDLMQLYKDMWSRVGERDGKYVKRAARYFQYLRGDIFVTNIAMLALIADDNVLDSFTKPNEIPCFDSWISMCQGTAKTLMPVSFGLLQIELADDWLMQQYDSASENGRKAIPWLSKTVKFVHRTAIDFLDSKEGKELFGKHTLGSEALVLLRVKVHLILLFFVRHRVRSLYGVWEILHNYELHGYKGISKDRPARIPHGTLSLIHWCASDESWGLVRPPYSISYETFFLIEASYHCFYEYVAEFLDRSEDYNLTASIYALIGACESINSHEGRSQSDRRYLAIGDVLQKQIELSSSNSESFQIRDASEGIKMAWRCFLVHELSSWERLSVSIDEKQLEGVLKLFIQCGVMESPGPKYLIAAQGQGLSIVNSSGPQHTQSMTPMTYDPSIYIEVNDAFLLGQLSEKISGASELVSIAQTNAFMRPIMADNGPGTGTIQISFFQISVADKYQESFKNWIFEGDPSSRLRFIPHEQPSFLNVGDLGEFENLPRALEKIHYDLPEVQKGNDCLHRWVVSNYLRNPGYLGRCKRNQWTEALGTTREKDRCQRY